MNNDDDEIADDFNFKVLAQDDLDEMARHPFLNSGVALEKYPAATRDGGDEEGDDLKVGGRQEVMLRFSTPVNISRIIPARGHTETMFDSLTLSYFQNANDSDSDDDDYL